ncbi:MAG: tRNA (adenosine(37)-N6)-threonylcarbamoyltransferase complex dimerization subunit type 1 TsaB [Clostridia bacterium]|nr:tRNA (adenosine(37)-N6)-threonylcarbamoyltransferase complex dimerization subunit type 1 TsaB [Clostridia bacterium]
MKILALDSTAKTSSVAVLENDSLLGLYSVNIQNTHSETLLPMIKSLLESLKLSNDDIDAYAVSEGPGSFTGVRIGAATIKGLAFGREKPCVGVSTIEALYENMADYEGIVCPIMNARRGQVYTGAFLNGKRILDDCCMMLNELLPVLEEKNVPIHFNGDGYDLVFDKEIKGFLPTPELLIYQNAFSVGKVAYKKLLSSEYVSDSDLRVEYLRKPQAEREREERLGGNENG